MAQNHFHILQGVISGHIWSLSTTMYNKLTKSKIRSEVRSNIKQNHCHEVIYGMNLY